MRTSSTNIEAPYDYYYDNCSQPCIWGDKETHLFSKVNLDSITSCLDIGCGDGVNSLFLETCKKDVVGIDKSESAIKRLAKRFSLHGSHPRGRYKKIDVLKFEAKEMFDLIISTGLYHCLARPDREKLYLKFYAEVLKPNGLFLFSTLTDSIAMPSNHQTPEFDLPNTNEVCSFLNSTKGEILYFREGVIQDSCPGVIGAHHHSVAWAIIKKSST